jgi:hypothetical protein
MCIRHETQEKAWRSLAFSLVSKPHTHITYMLRQCTSIVYLLTYSIYFSYAIFLTDYKKILKIAGGVKQLTVPLLPDPNCSMTKNDAQCVIPVKCCISFKTMLCPNLLMVWYADIIIFSGFVVMCMYIR